MLQGMKQGPQGGTCLEGRALTISQPLLGGWIALFPLYEVTLIDIVPGMGVKGDRLIGTRFPYFTDFLWLPVALVADVVSTAGVRRS
jgi:hypothetical protein